jgi:hypothetical protein
VSEGGASVQAWSLFSRRLFEAVRSEQERVGGESCLRLRLLGGDELYVDEVVSADEDGVLVRYLERGGHEPRPVAAVPWTAVLRVDVVDRPAWSGGLGFRAER